jgi:peroxiredoxin
MFKKIFFAAVLAMLTIMGRAQVAGQEKFTLEGVISTTPLSGKLYLDFNNGGQVKKDSVQVSDGNFVFKGILSEPVMATLSYKDGQPKKVIHQFSFYLEPGHITLMSADSLKTAMVIGSETDKDFAPLRKAMLAFRDSSATLYRKYAAFAAANDTIGRNAILNLRKIWASKLKDSIFRGFIVGHTNSAVALYALQQFGGGIIDPDEVDPMFKILSPSVQQLPSGKALSEKIGKVKDASIGHMAKGFVLPDTSGKMISLANFKGKYVLVDFWASWCGPCRAENPNVVKAYHRYKSKGFTVIGVSLDKGKPEWLKAIKTDHLEWTHVLDADQAVAKQYGLMAIPQNLLLDPDGKIVAKNVRGSAIEKTLATLFNN